MDVLEDFVVGIPSHYDFDASGQQTSNSSKPKRQSVISALVEKLLSSQGVSYTSLSHEIKAYKNKFILSKQKLEHFFGLSIPIDINIAEIEEHGLKALLQSRVPLCYFMYCMLEDYSIENLFFVLEVDQFEYSNFDSTKLMKKVATGLYSTFIKTGSDFEVNIDEKIKATILERISKGDQKCFFDAKEHILRLIEPKVQVFKNSYIFEKMKRELGYTCVYSRAARNAGVRLLLRNLNKDLPQIVANHDTSRKHGPIENLKGVSLKRNSMIRGMIHAFCVIRLGVDFVDSHYSNSTENPSNIGNYRSSFKSRSERSFTLPIDIIDFDKEEDLGPDPFELYLESLKS